MAEKTTPLPLIRTKLHRKPVAPFILFLEKPLQGLAAGHHLRLLSFAAPEGYSKSTIISRRLETFDVHSY